MSRNIRGDESALENVLSLVEALLQLSEEQDCESKLPLCAVWDADKLRITGYKSEQTRGNRSKTTEVGTKKEYLLKQIKDAGKTLKLPPQKAEFNLSQDKRELDELQTALDWLKELGVREDQKSTKSQGYWKFILTLKHQTATIKENLEVVKQKWKEHQKTNLKETFQTQTTDNSLDWQEICRAMLEKHKRLTTNELLFADDEMKFELEAIHVPLALVERTKPKKCSEDISAEQGSQLYEPSYEEKQRFEHQAFLEQIIRDGVGKTQGHRIALIGEPGAGKTTQLQTIAFWILNNNLGLPIWISLADLQGKSVENYLLQDWLKNALEVVEDVTKEDKNAFADLFKNNRVWLLLDAADEMSSLQPLTEISQQLTGWVKNARVVLTCRVNVWEANAGALENFETYRLLNFEYPQQVQEFIERWFQPRNLTPQPPLLIKERGSNKGEKLWQELDKAESKRIQDLVKNPLRLALLCSTWQGSDQGLPETKAGLYQQFVEEVYKWKENRFPTTEQQQEELNAALGRLAKRAIDQETSRFRLGHKLVREELGDPKQQNSLFSLALKLGWLNEVGLAAESATKEKVYAFYHPTFEEYFAALAIAALVELIDKPQLDDFTRRQAAESLEKIGSGNQKAIDALVELIDKPQLDDFTRRQAAESLEKIGSGNQKAIDALVELIGNSQVNDNTRRQAASSLGQIDPGNQKAIDALVELIGNSQVGDNTQTQAASSLGQIDPGNQKAIDALVELIGNLQVGDNTQTQAASSLGQIDPGNQKAIDALVELIGNLQIDALLEWELIGNSQGYYDTRTQAASSLGQIGSGNQKAIDALVELIGNSLEDNSTRRQAAESLGQIDPGNQKAINALVELISNSQVNNYTRWQAAESLEKIGSGNQKAIDALVELIGNSQKDNSTRRQAAESLGQIDPSNQKAINALVELISNSQVNNYTGWNYTRWQAASSLEKIMLKEQMPSVVTALKDYLSPESYKNDFKRFDNCYEVIWKCAQSMPYPAFYQAWHQQEKVKDGE